MITWTVTDMERTAVGGVVRLINYLVVMTDGQYSASSYGTVGVPYKSPSDPGFIPFDDLTEAETVAWVKENLKDPSADEIEANLAKNIELQKHPVYVDGLPWSN
jgi:hypothetical protein